MVKHVVSVALLWAFLSPGVGAPRCGGDGPVVAIDIGHTPARGGATSARGRPEYAFNRRLAGELLSALGAAGVTRAFEINAAGSEIGLKRRTQIARERAADLLLSIHHDSVQTQHLESWTFGGAQRRHTPEIRGYSLFVSYKGGDPEGSERLAQAIGKALRREGLMPSLHHAEPIRGEHRPLLNAQLGVYRFDDLVVLRTASMPAVLIEAGVILHRDEEALLDDPAYRRRIVDALVSSVWAQCPNHGFQLTGRAE